MQNPNQNQKERYVVHKVNKMAIKIAKISVNIIIFRIKNSFFKKDFVPKNENASEPSQVHLSLTNRPGEMTITWVTFHDESNRI